MVTRFPPEPNGRLHLGHAKAAFLDHLYARRKHGVFILRFDDTNPDTAHADHYDAILADLLWLGCTPDRVTHTSDYFPQLLSLAQRLVAQGHAYTCLCPPARIKQMRRQQLPCPCRDKAPSLSASEFARMCVRDALPPASVCLRLRCDMQSPNAAMRDPVAYRIKTAPHPRLGSAWAAYPTYDFSHPIVDSLENITHSFCTLEFSDRGALYVWLNRLLGLYCPVQIEFSRLEIAHALLAKRKLRLLLQSGVVSGWDDPRLPTLAGLRRRGLPAAALHRLLEGIAIGRQPTLATQEDLEAAARRALQPEAKKCFAVLDPLKLCITNWGDLRLGDSVDAPWHPKKPSRGSRRMPVSQCLYAERKMFRQDYDPSFGGLTPGGRWVRLLHLGYIRATDACCDEDGRVALVHCVFSHAPPDAASQIKGVLHWVAEPSPGKDPLAVVFRRFGPLFVEPEPNAFSSSELPHLINANACKVYSRVFVEPSCVVELQPQTPIQWCCHGYVALDPSSNPDEGHYVINHIAPLSNRESKRRIRKYK